MPRRSDASVSDPDVSNLGLETSFDKSGGGEMPPLEHCQRSNLRAEPTSTRETLTAPGDARDLQSKATCPCAFLYAFLAVFARALLQRCVDTCAARAWGVYTISSAVKV